MQGGSSDEHGKPEQMYAVSVDVFGAVVGVAGLAVRDGLAPLPPSHKEHWNNAWRARRTCSDFAVHLSPMQMR